jgi:hypothetical protein
LNSQDIADGLTEREPSMKVRNGILEDWRDGTGSISTAPHSTIPAFLSRRKKNEYEQD